MEKRFSFLHSLQDFHVKKGRLRLFIIFLALSLFFWVISKFSEQYTEVLTFEVKLDNLPKPVVPNLEKLEIELSLTASGFQLLLYKLLNPKIDLDSSKGVFENNIGTISLQTNIQEIQEQLFGKVNIVALFPTTLSFSYSSLQSKRLPLMLQSPINVEPGFGVSEAPVFIPDSIDVAGPSNILDTLEFIYLNNLSRTNINKSFSTNFPLINPAVEQLKFSETNVQLLISIDRFSEKTIKVPIKVINVPDSIAIKLFPSEVSLTFSAPISKIKSIDAIDFLMYCDFKSIEKDKPTTMEVQLNQPSSQLQNIRWMPKNVEYLIRK